jgi:hypothetical protein
MIRFPVLAIGLMILTDRCHGQADIHQIRAELGVGWAKLQEIDESNKSYAVEKNQHSLQDEKVVENRSVVQVRMNMKAGLYLSEMAGKNEQKGVYAHNQYYSFSVVKNDSTVDWKLSAYAKAAPGGSSLDRNILNEANLGYFYPLSSHHGTMLIDLLAQPDFVIERSERLQNGHVKIVYRRTTPIPGTKDSDKSRGWLILDPARYWSILESNEEDQSAPSKPSTRKRSFAEHPQLVLICTSVVETFDGGDRTLRFVNYSADPIPEQLFRLPHYGLPEAVDAPPLPQPKSRRYLWILLGSAGAILLAMLFWRLSRRRSIRTIPKTYPVLGK